MILSTKKYYTRVCACGGHGYALNTMDNFAGAGSWQELWPLRGAHAGTGFVGDVFPRGGPMLEQTLPEGLDSVERTHAEELCEELQKIMKDCMLN